jgi:hypothetical protein
MSNGLMDMDETPDAAFTVTAAGRGGLASGRLLSHTCGASRTRPASSPTETPCWGTVSMMDDEAGS